MHQPELVDAIYQSTKFLGPMVDRLAIPPYFPLNRVVLCQTALGRLARPISTNFEATTVGLSTV